MCLMDWQLGRLVRSRTMQFGFGVNATLTANQQRVGVLVGLVGNDNPLLDGDYVTVSSDSLTVTMIAPVNMPWLITLMQHGDLPTKELVIGSLSGGIGVAVTEFFLPEEYLNIPIEELRKKYTPWLPAQIPIRQ